MPEQLQTHVAYRCPECNTTVYGYVGKFALSASLLRLKCSCGHSAMDIAVTGDGKIKLSVPCIFCKQNHSFTVSQGIFFGRDIFILSCPYTNMDIAFIGEKEKTDAALLRSQEEIEKLLTGFEAKSISELQPEDMDEDEILPDPVIYDTIRFLVKDLEAEGKIDCPCHSGTYELRFCKEGIEVYCPECNASKLFNTEAASASEEYLSLDSVTLS